MDENQQSASSGNTALIRVDSEFQYKGATFEAGKYYNILESPDNFIGWYIEHNRQGARVNKLPSGVEALDDPRPDAEAKLKAAEDAEIARIRAMQGPRVEEPVVVAAPAGVAHVATTNENVIGKTHTPEGSTTAKAPVTGHASTQTETKSSSERKPPSDEAKPRVPRTD